MHGIRTVWCEQRTPFYSRYTTTRMLTTTILDTCWTGRPRSIAAVLLESDGHRAILDPGPASTLPTLRELLRSRRLTIADLDAILLTHIHLDHAGAAGALVRENARLEVYVHELGLPHMADPSKLLASAERLWPGQLTQLFGETLPVPIGNLRKLSGDETLTWGTRKLEVVYTPGHASHHVTYFDSSDGTAFVGDTTGMRIEDTPLILPVTPPPDIDLQVWDASLDVLSARQPVRLLLTHFGFANDPAEHIAAYRENLHRWGRLAGEIMRSTAGDKAALDAFVAATRMEIEKSVPASEVDHYVFNAGLDLSWRGLARYHRKRAALVPPPRVDAASRQA